MNPNDKINKIKSQARLLSESVLNVLDDPQSQKFLETIYTPFLSMVMQNNEWVSIHNPDNKVFKNFDELSVHLNPNSELYIPGKNVFAKDIEFKGGDYDLTVGDSLNIYEKLVYKLFGISYLELQYTEIEGSGEIKPDFEARDRLKKLLMEYKDIFTDIDLVDFLPMTLFEELTDRAKPDKYPTAKVHCLSLVYNENYLFYLAHLKENNTRVIGYPHGALFFQTTSVAENEIAEMILSDVYMKPSWELIPKALPNLRVSRNLFISAKNFISMKKKKRRMLVLLPYFFTGKEPPFVEMSYDISSNEFHHKRIKELKNHFPDVLDFKLHPAQKNFDQIKLDYINQIYLDGQLVDKGTAQKVSHEYNGIIHLNSLGTAIMELSTTLLPQYVYLGPEQRLDSEYLLFLWNTRKSTTREDYSNGAWIQVDNQKYRSAYGASYFYPFYFVNLIKKLMGSR